MTNKELKDRAKFFSIRLFNIPLLCDCRFATCRSEDNKRHVEAWFINSADVEIPINNIDEDGEEVFCIEIANKYKTEDVFELNNVLLHELTHYALYYQGYEYHDGDGDFERKLRELHVRSCYDRKWDQEQKRYIFDALDRKKMQEYEDMYQESLKANNKAAGE